MKARLIAVVILLGFAFSAHAQDSTFVAKYSIEIGTGIQPLQMTYYPTGAVQKRLLEQGKGVNEDGMFCPVITLSGVMRFNWKNELTLTGGVSWCHHRIMEYPVFGTDPYGKPRYDVTAGKNVGWMDSSPCFSLLIQWRHLWNPKNLATLYSGAGLGYSFGLSFPIPSLTPIGLRVGGEHFYGFVEGTIGPIATYVHGGLGWHF